jgi:sigma-B regulation protein RsbU (phosphoserine phosphatase)
MAPTQPSEAKSGSSGERAPGDGRGSASLFWERVTDGLELEELWHQFRADATAGYGLYSQEVDWETIRRKKRWKQPFHAAGALFWAMFMKLTPARRVLLLLAVALMAKGLLDIHFVIFTPRWTHFMLSALAMMLLLALELADRITMKRDLEIARDIQKWLVPEKPPEVPGFDIAFTTRPANTVAGDYYDVFFRGAGDAPPGQLLLVVADVAGKSVPAALLMATFQASLRALAAGPAPLEGVVRGLNHYACAHNLGGLRFTTAFLAEVDPDTRAMRYTSAGHNSPMLRRVDGSCVRLEEGGVPLGIQPDAQFESGSTTLARGDLLVIFSDGLVEAVNPAGDEFGEARLKETLDAVPGESAAETLKQIMQAVDRFVGRARQHDDMTCLIVRVV